MLVPYSGKIWGLNRLSDRLRNAFDCIRAEEKLKKDTLVFLQGAAQRRKAMRTGVIFKGMAAVFIALALVSGIFTYNLYLTPHSYVDMDVNPSVGLTINRFERVIEVYAYNTDGEGIIAHLALKHQHYEAALTAFLEAVNEGGYMRNNTLVTVTLQTDDSVKEAKMLGDIQSEVSIFMSAHHGAVQADVFPVSGETRHHACEWDVSPAKYIAIQDVLAFDPSASVESCKHHSINELREMTQKITESHHHGSGGSHDEGHD